MAQVEDNGQGFDVAKVLNHQWSELGTGLLGIQERVTLLGGTFNVYTAPGQGTRLALEIPLEKSNEHG